MMTMTTTTIERPNRLWSRILIALGLLANCALLIALAALAEDASTTTRENDVPAGAITNHARRQSSSPSPLFFGGDQAAAASHWNSNYPSTSSKSTPSSSRLHSFLREYWIEYSQWRRLDEQGNNNNNNNNGKQQQGNGNNFYFDDYIQDDLVQTRDDDQSSSSSGGGGYNNNNVIDDFYAFEVDRTPHLLPLSSNTIFGFFIASLALSLGASSGTGGGGTITPIYILIIGLPIQVAVPIGAVSVLGGSLACTSLNWRRRHPLADRVLIDWDLILVMEPLTLVGALVGSLLHKMLSEKILVVLLVLLLSITAHTTLSKAMRMYHAENRYIRHLRKTYGNKKSTTLTSALSSPPAYPKIQTWGTMDPAEAESLASGSQPHHHDDTAGDQHWDHNNSGSHDHNNAQSDQCSVRTLPVNNGNSNNKSQPPSSYSQQHERQQQTRTADNVTGNDRKGTTSMSQRQKETAKTRRLHDAEKEEILIENPDYITLRSELMEQEKFTPSGKIMALFCMFFVIIFLSLMAGGGESSEYNSPWGIECDSTAFWVVHIVMIAFLIGSAWAAQTYVVARHEIKEIVRFDYVHGDIKWDTRSAIIYPALFVTAGFFAGTLGIGGGVITVPIILTMGVHPAVTTATSSAMIFFTSSAAVTTFFVFRLILLDFAAVAFVVGFCASFTGSLIMSEVRQARSASGRNFERNSFTAFAIGGVVLVSALLMTIEYVFLIVEQPEEIDNGGLCEGLRFN